MSAGPRLQRSISFWKGSSYFAFAWYSVTRPNPTLAAHAVEVVRVELGAHQWGNPAACNAHGTPLLFLPTCYFCSIRGSDAFAYRRTICGHGSGSCVAQLLCCRQAVPCSIFLHSEAVASASRENRARLSRFTSLCFSACAASQRVPSLTLLMYYPHTPPVSRAITAYSCVHHAVVPRPY
jgi:hypothetical protein